MSQELTLTYESEISDICKLNSSFDKGVLKICYVGKNRNGSYLSKEVIEKSFPSLFNCPVVCNYDRETDTLGGHDMELVKSDDNLKIVNLTTPVGVIPESAKVWFEEFEEEDGTKHEYLCSDVLLWKRQEAYDKIKRDGITAHSMEINVKSGKLADGVYCIDDFEFTAFALIGTTPCFESSSLETFGFKNQMSDMMRDLKETIKSFSIDTSKTKGGNDKMNKANSSAAKNGEADKKDFSLTENLIGEIVKELRKETVKREWGDEARYEYIDCDVALSEVYCYDISDRSLYGFSFSVNGDAVIIDFESKKRKKIAITDFMDGEEKAPVLTFVWETAEKLHKENAELKAKFSELEDKSNSYKTELEELRLFKAETEAAELKKKREEIFSLFEDLRGNEVFEALKNQDDLDLTALEEKCFALRGRNSKPLNFSAKNKSPKLKVDKADLSAEPYGGLFIKYSNK